MTDVYVFSREEGPLSEELAGYLPAWRRERLERLHDPEARQECLCAGLLYAFVLLCHGVPPQEPVTTLPAGKPVFQDRRDLYFSLSHSGRYVLCAISPASVGADVQEIRKVKLSIARRFHQRERDWLAEQPLPEQAIFQIWTRKEAWVKAVSDQRVVSLAEVDVMHLLREWQFQDLCLEDNAFQAAVCFRRGEELSAWRTVKQEELLAVLGQQIPCI